MARLVFQLEQVGTVILRIFNFCKLKSKLTIYFFELNPHCSDIEVHVLAARIRLSFEFDEYLFE